MFYDLDYEGIEFPVSKKDYSKIEQKNDICINVICYENELTYPVYVSYKKCMNLLLIVHENKSYYVYIKDFNRFMRNETKNNNKKRLLQILFTMF